MPSITAEAVALHAPYVVAFVLALYVVCRTITVIVVTRLLVKKGEPGDVVSAANAAKELLASVFGRWR